MLAVLGLVLPQPMPFAPARAQDNAASVRCAALPMDATQSPPTLKPPPDWQGKSVSLQMQLNRDGAPMAVSVARPSGSPELDAAAMAHVQQAWRWQPLRCGDSGTAEATIAIPQLDSCMAQRLAHTMTPPPTPPTGKGVARQAQLNLSIGRDGTVQRASIGRSSGVAELDAAAISHVRQTWRYWPLPENCRDTQERITIHFPQMICDAQAIRETQTAPDTEPEDEPHSAQFHVSIALDGTVQDVVVTRSSGIPALDRAGTAHVKQNWRWQPFSCPAGTVMQALVGMDFPAAFPLEEVRP